MSEDTSWVEAMTQQVRNEIKAEAARLVSTGMSRDMAVNTARKRAALSMRVRSELLDAVAKAAQQESYAGKNIEEKIGVLREALAEGVCVIRDDLISPIERVIEDSRSIVEHELITRIEIELLSGGEPNADEKTGATDARGVAE